MMVQADVGRRLEEILKEKGVPMGFIYGAPEGEEWNEIVDREIKLEPMERTKGLMSLFYQAFSSADMEFPYWYSRQFAESDGDVIEVRRAKALACAYAHTTPSIYPKDLLPGLNKIYSWWFPDALAHQFILSS